MFLIDIRNKHQYFYCKNKKNEKHTLTQNYHTKLPDQDKLYKITCHSEYAAFIHLYKHQSR